MEKEIIHYICERPEFIHVDEWIPNEEDKILNWMKDEFVVPVSSFLNQEQNLQLDCFSLKVKKSYKSVKAKDHFCQYLNYFEKFYDKDKELISIYSRIKCMIDGYKDKYTPELLKQDINNYLLSYSMKWKVRRMNNDNYIPLEKKYKNSKKPGLEYNDIHCKLMLELSLFQIMMIPILTHYAYVNKVLDITNFLLEFYDLILYMKNVTINLPNKFYETVKSSTEHSTINNPIWDKQDIRGLNPTTFAIEHSNSIILQLMPKYIYSSAAVALNFNSIKQNIDHQVIGNEYEFVFVKLDNIKKDEDSNSEFDKFESYTAKQDESLYIELNHIARESMKMIEFKYGPFDQAEIEFYKKELFDDTDCINNFQKHIVFNLFYQIFGDTESIKAINKDDYIKLVIAAKRIFHSYKMVIMPYVVSSKIVKSVSRKTINKKEEKKIDDSEIFELLMKKYNNNPKVKEHILSIIATIYSSTFRMIDYNDRNINGKIMPLFMEFISKEVCDYAMLT